MFPRLFAALAAYALMLVASFAEECPNHQQFARARAYKVVASEAPVTNAEGKVGVGNSIGSGVALTDWYVLTNLHVVEGAKKLHVHLVTGEAFPATTVKKDPLFDLALLKLESPLNRGIRPVRVADAPGKVDDLYQLWSNNQARWLAGQVVALPYLASPAGNAVFFYTQFSGLHGDSGTAVYNCKAEIMGIVQGFRLRKLLTGPPTEVEKTRLNELFNTLNIGLYGGSTAGIDAFSHMSAYLRSQLVRPEPVRAFVCGYNRALLANCPAPAAGVTQAGQVSARTAK